MNATTTGDVDAGALARGAKDARAARHIRYWLYAMCVLLAAMIAVGGATRLTESGLSITEWKPVMGAIPPLSHAAWAEEFAKYKTIPQYELMNAGMTLDQFKGIYWWEWSHRLLGRIIGFAFLAPLLWFLVTRQARGKLAWRLGGLFVLGGLQGALGWFMVMSGLSDRVEVSQYRLAAHLALALVIFSAILWTAFSLRPPRGRDPAPRSLAIGAWALAGGVFVQMILGAFVAGLRAGKAFNTWPLMNGKIVPDGYFSGAPGFSDLFETVAASQFNHRTLAYLLFAGALAYWLHARRAAAGSAHARRAGVLFAAVSAQVMLGIWTVLAVTPLALALPHQVWAVCVLTIALWNVAGYYSGSPTPGGAGGGVMGPASKLGGAETGAPGSRASTGS